MTDRSEALLRAAVIEAHARALAALPAEAELRQTLTLSPAHLRRMEALGRRAVRGSLRARWKRVWAAALGAAALLFLLLGVTLAASPTLRARAADWLAPIFTGGRYSWNVAVPDGGEHTDAPPSFAPSWVPEGYTLAYSGDNPPVRDLFYSDGEGGSFYLSYTPLGTSSSYTLRNTEQTVRVISEDGQDYYMLAAEKSNYIFWTADGVMFRLSSTLDTETLLKIAASVRGE